MMCQKLIPSPVVWDNNVWTASSFWFWCTLSPIITEVENFPNFQETTLGRILFSSIFYFRDCGKSMFGRFWVVVLHFMGGDFAERDWTLFYGYLSVLRWDLSQDSMSRTQTFGVGAMYYVSILLYLSWCQILVVASRWYMIHDDYICDLEDSNQMLKLSHSKQQKMYIYIYIHISCHPFDLKVTSPVHTNQPTNH